MTIFRSMWSSWIVPLPNYLEIFGGGSIYVTNCGEILQRHNEKLKKICKPSIRKYYLNGHSAIPIDLILELSKEDPNILNECFIFSRKFGSRSNKPHKLPKNITAELAYLIGTLRDGSIAKTDYRIYISQSGEGAREWLENLSQIFEKIFEVKTRIKKINNEYRLNIYSKSLRIFIEKLFEMPFDQNKWCTPKIIEENKETWIPYVSGFFDAEGYCTSKETFEKTGKVKIAFTQNNLKSLEFIKKVLEYYEIKTGEIFLEKDEKRYALYIQSKNEILKFISIFKSIRKGPQLLELRGLLKTPELVPSEMSPRTASLEISNRVKH